MALSVSNVVASATTTNQGTGTTRTVNLPTSGVSEGDIMYVAIVYIGAASVGDILTATGWTKDWTGDVASTTSTPRGFIFHREVPPGGLGATVDFDTSNANFDHAAVAFAITGAEATPDVIGTAQTDSSGTLSCPAVTASGTGGLALRFGFIDADDESSQPAMSGHTAINWAEDSNPGNGGGVFCWVDDQASTSVGAATASISSEEWAGQTIVVSEAGGASGASVTVNLVDIDSSVQANLSNLRWDWFNEPDPQNFNAPSDQGTVETTDGTGELVLDLPNTTLTTGQTGFLVLRDATNNFIGGYRLDID